MHLLINKYSQVDSGQCNARLKLYEWYTHTKDSRGKQQANKVLQGSTSQIETNYGINMFKHTSLIAPHQKKKSSWGERQNPNN